MYEFYIPIDPREMPTAQQKGERVVFGAGKPFIHHYEKKKVRDGRKRLEWRLYDLQQITKDCDTIHEGAVFITVEFVYGLGSKPKKYAGAYKSTRPDIDNLLKGLFDACTNRGMWSDDAQVQISRAVKRYAKLNEEPHIYLRIETELDELTKNFSLN